MAMYGNDNDRLETEDESTSIINGFFHHNKIEDERSAQYIYDF